MKLKVTDWRNAWFESHISDRFFQEMARLEKGSVQGLETSVQWTEQIMIEVGLLAQAMIRLEHGGTSEPQIRQAYEKAMRLAALGLHLITALDGTDREQLRSSAIVHTDAGDWSHAPAAAVPLPTASVSALPTAAARNAGSGAAPAQRPAEPPAPQAAPQAGGKSRSAALPAHLAARTRTVPPRAPVEPPPEPAKQSGAFDPAMFSSLVQVSGIGSHRSESATRQTIVALSQQGLSRAEIEMITGEPRHVVEAVLNHARGQTQAGA